MELTRRIAEPIASPITYRLRCCIFDFQNLKSSTLMARWCKTVSAQQAPPEFPGMLSATRRGLGMHRARYAQQSGDRTRAGGSVGLPLCPERCAQQDSRGLSK